MCMQSSVRRAFSLLELLASIAIIAILISTLVFVMAGVRGAAQRTGNQAALRQLGFALSSYGSDHQQRIMPGYLGYDGGQDMVTALGITGSLPTGETLPNNAELRSYVWRLSPYLDNAWQSMFEGYGAQKEKIIAQYQDGLYGPTTAGAGLGLSETPAFGMNSLFVGGDNTHGGPAAAFSPWNTSGNTKIAAVRFSEVRSPSSVISFMPAAQVNPTHPDFEAYRTGTFGESVGAATVLPPFTILSGSGSDAKWGDHQWTIGREDAMRHTDQGDYDRFPGLPIVRGGGGSIPVVHLDGSTTLEALSELSRDMRRWSPFETGRREQVLGEALPPYVDSP